MCTLDPGDWTIEKILQEKKQFDASLAFEKKADDQSRGWSQPAPSSSIEPDVAIASNVLAVYADPNNHEISVTGADRSWNLLSAAPPHGSSRLLTNAHGSPILSVRVVPPGHLLTTSMSGQLMLHEAKTGRLLDKCRHHLKYAIQVTSDFSPSAWIIATAGWDQKVHIYAPDGARLDHIDQLGSMPNDSPVLPNLLGEPIHTITLPSNPEAIVFVRNPDTSVLHLVVSRRDSTHLFYYAITPEETNNSTETRKFLVTEAGRQNLAPHSNAWVAFTPSSLAISPTDPTLLAVATSHLPHMKLLIVRLLFPGPVQDQPQPSQGLQTPASRARAELALQDREDAAISIHITTMAPQTPYSTPQVVWRPHGDGVWVNGDDGAIRGIEVSTGKVVAVLKGHEPGTKVRTLWAGNLKSAGSDDTSQSDQEVLISGGFDKKVLIWTAVS